MLRGAWAKVSKSGFSSPAQSTKTEVKQFASRIESEFRGIKVSLRTRQYRFGPATPIVLDRFGPKPRPLLVSGVRDRVVQRALLDVLCGIGPIAKMTNNQWSFGTSASGGVGDAIHAVTNAIDEGRGHYARSDISGFYRNIQRDAVLAAMKPALPTELFELLTDALNVSFDRSKIPDAFRGLFPNDEIGIAQGSPLSTLCGNVLLREFDAAMNQKGVTCIRYADDFVLLAERPHVLRTAMEEALARLAELKLSARDPFSPKVDRTKAQKGHVNEGFDFLGCHIRGTRVAPSKSSKDEFLQHVQDLLKNGLHTIREAPSNQEKPRGVAGVISDLQHMSRAWAKAYSFCTDKLQFQQLDDEVDGRLQMFLNRVRRTMRQRSSRETRLLLGVGLLAAALDR